MAKELEPVGAEVHLAEPTETSGLKSKKKRAETDWADARHLRELLLVGRLPESWIAPALILDLRGRVRLRHTLSHQRTECQQRIQAVLYHHGIPQRRDLLTLEKRRGVVRLLLGRGCSPARRSRAPSVATLVIRDDREPVREQFGEPLKVPGVAARAHDQENRGTGASDLVVELGAVDLEQVIRLWHRPSPSRG